MHTHTRRTNPFNHKCDKMRKISHGKSKYAITKTKLPTTKACDKHSKYVIPEPVCAIRRRMRREGKVLPKKKIIIKKNK